MAHTLNGRVGSVALFSDIVGTVGGCSGGGGCFRGRVDDSAYTVDSLRDARQLARRRSAVVAAVAAVSFGETVGTAEGGAVGDGVKVQVGAPLQKEMARPQGEENNISQLGHEASGLSARYTFGKCRQDAVVGLHAKADALLATRERRNTNE